MEFLNDAVIKAKDVFDVARRKTGEVVTAEKKRFEISLLRSKREKDLAGLGRIYQKLLGELTLVKAQPKGYGCVVSIP